MPRAARIARRDLFNGLLAFALIPFLPKVALPLEWRYKPSISGTSGWDDYLETYTAILYTDRGRRMATTVLWSDGEEHLQALIAEVRPAMRAAIERMDWTGERVLEPWEWPDRPWKVPLIDQSMVRAQSR